MKKLLFLGACLVTFASQPVVAQTGGPHVIVVQLYFTGIGTQHIITRGEGKTQDIQLKNTSPEEHKAAEAYQRVMEGLFAEGYTLKSTFSLGTTANVTLLFEKRQ
jgi:hypothetical protein